MTDPTSYDRAIGALRQARSSLDTAVVHVTALEHERRALVASDRWPDPNEGAGLIVVVPPTEDLTDAMRRAALSPIPDGPAVFHVAVRVPPVVLDRPWATTLCRGRVVRIVGKVPTVVDADPSGASVRLERGMGDVEGLRLELWSLRLRGDLRRERGLGRVSVRWMDTVVESREVEPSGL